ncbi:MULTISPECIES: sigma-54 dependent transcriptional regulator [Thioalkalivibrio]|uniref:sigma-54-dependent transcriptional regulator n=1 Tax=Thioalkalivibrio TaxID=106633 RepID=UPI00036E46A6|nr:MULTISPECIES: sigma-54 dependent transcriptional regulator [Thioalkalivibrio]OOC48528.1 sigma-54-dependent Fis family transcriptional regulator [Thioalkalivibrio versutus]
MSIRHVLVVDDEPDICELLEITLARMGLEATTATRLEPARALIAEHDFDLCLTDMRLPDGDGLDLVRHIQSERPELPVAVITAHGSVDTAVLALKLGAFDFVSKPVDLKQLRELIDAALRLEPAASIAEEPGDDATPATPDDSPLLGQSEPMQRLRATIHKLARSQAPVFISGESGSGKELVAREIHRLGPRAERPFVPVNCGAIPGELMESEFFGHRKGAFTGATQDHTGLFQSADGGTLFLDEVADLPLPMQVKLLRAIQERAIKPVGGTREIPVDVRILSATHHDLEKAVREGRFRQDLYYRLNVIELKVPPLRARRGDIERLATRILQRIGEQWQTGDLELAPDALAALQGHGFPGNVRELENILERAATLCEGPLIRAGNIDLPANGLGTEPTPGAKYGEPENGFDGAESALDDQLAAQERQAIATALQQTGGNRTAAARLLGLSFRQLRYRLKKLGID